MSEKTKELSKDALRILEQIHRRGLTVLWSFTVAHPNYDDGEEMPHDDWWLIRRELWSSRRVHDVHPALEERKRLVRVVRSGMIREVYSVWRGSDGWIDVESRFIEVAPVGMPDQEISREETTNFNPIVVDYTVQESEWILTEGIPADDWTEEFIGLTSRYTLKPAAVELLEREGLD